MPRLLVLVLRRFSVVCIPFLGGVGKLCILIAAWLEQLVLLVLIGVLMLFPQHTPTAIPDGHLDGGQALVVVACGASPTAVVCDRPLGLDGACLHGSNCRIKALISSVQAFV